MVTTERPVVARKGVETMEADEINQGLAQYLWAPDYYPVVGTEEIFAAGELHSLFTDSLDACEKVADKLGVVEWMSYPARMINQDAWAVVTVEYPDGTANPFEGDGPTRSHALAAALWAAVRETTK